MQKAIITLFFISPFFFVYTFATTSKITKSENGHSYIIMKVIFDGDSKIVVSAVESGQPAKSLQTLMYDVGGTHAINGGFFCPNEKAYSRCTPNTTDLIRKVDGVLYSKREADVGSNKSVFGFDVLGMPLFVTDDGSYKQETDVSTIYNGIGMPTLVKDGVNVAIYNDAMNSDPKQSTVGNKAFICSTKNKDIVYMGYVDGVTFSSVADYIIQTFNCYNATQLDNGGSKAMITNGNYVIGPGRNIMDAFVIIDGNNIGPVIMPDGEAYSSEDLQDAIAWMYNQGLTKFNTITSFMAKKTMTREEASKFFSLFAIEEFKKTEFIENQCSFFDIQKADWSLINNIIQGCRLGLFKGSKGFFTPKEQLTKAQAIAVLIRIVVGKMDESMQPRYTNYIQKAQELALITNINPDNNMTRGEAAILLYKAHIYRVEHQ